MNGIARSITLTSRLMSIKGILPLVLTCVFSATTATADQNLGSILTDQYRDQVLALRHSFKSKKQEYGADGVPTRTSEEGPWTLYGGCKKDQR